MPAPSLSILVGFRVIQGMASAMILGTSMEILTSVIPPQSRGKVLGLNSAATYISLSCIPVLGDFIGNALSWCIVFCFYLIINIIVIILTVWKLKGEWKGKSSKLDCGGIALCVLAQASLLFGLSDLATGFLYQVCFVLVIILFVIFLYMKKDLCCRPTHSASSGAFASAKKESEMRRFATRSICGFLSLFRNSRNFTS